MANRKPLTDDEGEVRELTEEDFAQFVPFSALPFREQEMLRSLKRLRGPQKSATKQRITIRLSAEVVSKFRATGKGWQSRIDQALQEWLKRHANKLSA